MRKVVAELMSDNFFGGLKANTGIKFLANLINIQGVLNEFKYEVKLNFCHASGVAKPLQSTS